ncbi:MAG: hypothetical protein IKP02_00355 [Paludibacteraceae bacterium]|nr:hypothetical protein [Paludibacteraceae bacterium]
MTNFKRFLTLFFISTLALSVWGGDYTLDGLSTPSDAIADGFTFSTGGTGTTPAWNAGSSELRIYVNDYLEIDGGTQTITGIVYTLKQNQGGSGSGKAYPTGFTMSTGSASFTSGSQGSNQELTWTGSASTVRITVNGAKGNYGFKSISITTSGGASCDENPTVGTIMNAVSGISATGATFSTSAGVSAGTGCSFSEVGFVYNTTGTPNVDDDTKAVIDSYTSGNLNKSVSGLTPNTTYYVRAFATNGHGTSYSDQKSFKTDELTGEEFDLVTDVNDLADGDEIIILNEDNEVALSTTQNSGNRSGIGSGASIWTISGTTVTVISPSVQVLTISPGDIESSYWQFYTGSGYLYAAASGSNQLKTQNTNNVNGEWEININSSGVASIVATGSSNRNVMQMNPNSGNPIFACYSTASQTDLRIYRKVSTSPKITAPSSVTGFTYNYGEGPDTKTMEVSGKNLTGNLTVELEDGDYQISLNNIVWTTSLTLTATAGIVNSTTVYVRLVSGLSVGTHNGSISVSGGGATTKNVTLEGAVTLECSTPTLSFAGSVSSVEKLLGSGKFTIAASSPDNTLKAAITYSSSNTSKATVDENSGEVTLVQATGSGSPVTITATLAYKNTGVACQNEVTASYTLTIYNKVTWQVGEDEYTGGSPTTQVLQGGQITTFPSDPDGDALCGGKVFIGWTNAAVADPVDVAPTPMYKTLSDLSSVYINSNTTFYAVFAASSSGATPTLTQMREGDTFTAGDKIVIVAKYGSNNVALYQETTNTNYVQTWTFDNNAATVAADDKNWLTVSTATGGWYLGDNTNGYIRNSGNNLYCDASKVVWTLVDKEDGTDCFRLLSGDRYLSYRSDLSTKKWRMGGTSYGTSGSCDLYVYKFTGSGTTYSDYSTTCGTCLSAPTDPVVTPKSNRATITWAAVPDATGYTVTCTGGSVSVVGTTATITGLTAETSYDFTIRSQGSDPYSCFPAYHGSFTTTACEDSPVLGAVTVTTTSATIPWTCDAATSTIRVYTDYACTEQVGGDHTLCTSPYTVTPLTSNTTYYYKVLAGGSCSSAVGSFKTEEIKLDIAEWQTDAVVVSFNGDANLTLTTLTEETHGDPHENVADDIFFSKYFEAAKNVKLLGIFNGTMHNVNLANYELGLAQSSGAEKAFTFTKFSDFVKANELGVAGGGLTEDELLLKSNEEIILITYTNGDDDPIIACAKEDEEHSKYSTYIRISTPALQFNGDDVVSLKDPDGNLIDIIGAGTKAEGSKHSGTSFQSYASGVDHNGFMDQPGGWYNVNGYHALDGNLEANGYALSTNRCLLIRRKYVKSGYAAVERNTEDFVTLGDYTYMGDNYEGEWKGVQIPGSTTTGSKPGLSNSCDGFAVLGGYNYNDYYVAFEISGTPTTFEDLKSDPFDGTYEIPVTGLIDKACTFVRIELKDGSDNLVIRKDVKVPIMISGSKHTTDDIFHSHYKDEDICRACDVIILNGGTLTKVADGTTGDIDEVRDLKIYPNGKLVIPSGRNYTVNSLAFRRQEDNVATANIQGGLAINETKAVYLDVRIDPSNWHYLTLPYDCNVSDITFSTGDPAVLGTDYLLKWYNGEKRAATQAGGCWEMVGASSVLRKGIGYIVALPGDDIIKKELRFPMANTVIAEDKDDKNVAGIYGYGCDKDYTQVRANHRGWNLIGNPYFLPYTSDITNPLLIGKIVPDYSTDPWDGHYKFDEEPSTQLRYIVEPVNNGWSEYRQVAIADYEMTPFTCYFVQIGADDPLNPDPALEQGIEFHVAKVDRSSIVRRSPEEYEDAEDTHPVWCAIDLTNSKGEQDETTLLISNDFTDGYDIMNDLVKMRGDYYQYAQITTKPVLASRNNEGEMAFNALPDASAVAGVPLNFFTAYNGEYNISYNNKYDKDNEVTEVKLLDTKTNEWYDLMNSAYTFTTNRENNNTRFILSVSVNRRKGPQITTGVNNWDSETNGPRKILRNGHLFIIRGGNVYDVTGKEVQK